MFTRVMSLPDAERADVLELLGGSTVDDAKLNEILEEIADVLAKRQACVKH